MKLGVEYDLFFDRLTSGRIISGDWYRDDQGVVLSENGKPEVDGLVECYCPMAALGLGTEDFEGDEPPEHVVDFARWWDQTWDAKVREIWPLEDEELVDWSIKEETERRLFLLYHLIDPLLRRLVEEGFMPKTPDLPAVIADAQAKLAPLVRFEIS
jgi:hypothetical protein